MATTLPKTIKTIDGHYHYPGRAAAYLLSSGDEAAFVDNVTRFSIPYLMEALDEAELRPEQVRYVIVTHVHLDHSGGTAELVKHCPNATVIAHPRAARHIVDPTKLVNSARPIYGDEVFERVFGVIEPVDAEIVQSMDDGETLELGGHTLTFLDSPGHARHHFVIHDSGTNSVFSGDAFGLYFPQLQGGSKACYTYVCAPPQFDPAAGRNTIRRIMDLNPDHVFVTHFGECSDIQKGGARMIHMLDAYEAAVDTAAKTDLEGDALLEYCTKRSTDIIKQELAACGLDTNDETVLKWALAENAITSQGLVILAEQRRSEAAGA